MESAIILHNFLEMKGEKWEECEFSDDPESEEIQIVDHESDTERTQRILGQQKRNQMLDHFFP